MRHQAGGVAPWSVASARMEETGLFTRDGSAAIADVAEVLKWTARSLADELRELDGGWVVRSQELTLVHSLNRLQVTAAMDPSDVLALADASLGDLPYRHVGVDDLATARAFEERVVTPGSGWKSDREVFMVLVEPTPNGADREGLIGSTPEADVPGPVARLTDEESDRLMRRWLVEEDFDTVPGALDQLSEVNRREGELWGETVLGIREAGEPVAFTKSRSHGDVGWVEDVYTVPEARRKGYARLLVSRAASIARRANHRFTFIIADDNDWPKHLYAELGFLPAGRTWTFHCDLAG